MLSPPLGISMRLLGVRLHLGKYELEAFIRTDDGFTYRVPCKWLERNQTDVPVETWFQTVCAEVEQHRRSLPDRDVLSAFRKRT